MHRTHSAGVTLIEVVVAILVLSVGMLALAGSSAITARRIAGSGRAAHAAAVARSRAESSFAVPCAVLSGGNQRTFGLRAEWSVASGFGSASISQRITYPTLVGEHSDNFLTSAPCG